MQCRERSRDARSHRDYRRKFHGQELEGILPPQQEHVPGRDLQDQQGHVDQDGDGILHDVVIVHL